MLEKLCINPLSHYNRIDSYQNIDTNVRRRLSLSKLANVEHDALWAKKYSIFTSLIPYYGKYPKGIIYSKAKKQIFQENWKSFLIVYKILITWYMPYNVWKVMSCREPDGLSFATFPCPDHSGEIRTVPRTCKSHFCSVCAKVQSDK